MSERMALAFEQREYSLLELDALANGMATVLEHRGVRAGARVALMASNRPEFVIALWAVWRLGASAVLLSPAWKRTEVESALALTTPSHAVSDVGRLERRVADLERWRKTIEAREGVDYGTP